MIIAPAWMKKKVRKHSEQKCDSGKPRPTCVRVQRQTSPPVDNSLSVQQNFSQMHTEDQTNVALARIFTQEFPTSLSTSFYSLPAALTSDIITD